MTYQEIHDKLTSTSSWQQSYREIMLLGKQLPNLPNALKTEQAQVKGCESNVWLHVELDESQQHMLLVGDSDTRIVKGLLAIVLSLYNSKTPTQAAKIDAYQEFESLGLIKHLSPSRGNGIKAIVDRIQTIALQWV
ncbi:Sulfur acceptor protein CsdE [Pseudoalteromonas holothuriae]|uniref:Sulfur acceptor protein CsdE n=1 Tax=Pseudoalteromonas holothuriae TaxID=2963714 RepID=A0A9W4QZS0_9GAMM|nr:MULTISPECIES: SufE family protein [unclassified Pseudoalteromonas]CAH9060482.1 Sulfur acceptor protein CsdE [Pseudoalteromonas sp. CIP111951]CAH9060658.1 Sulfur acceptor protein CsdE [Pseudoalteromonas sp. CIP111854]